MRTPTRTARFVRPILLLLLTVLAAVLPPLAAGAAIGAGRMGLMAAEAPPPYAGPLPERPAHDPARRTAVIVASARSTESSDFLAPYEALARAGAFNLYAVAPERRPVPLVPGNVDLIPHYAFAEYDAAIGVDPDLIVVPFLWDYPADPAVDAPVLAWLRARTGPRTTLLTICGGAWMAADAGLLDGRRATTHRNVLPRVAAAHPRVGWESGARWVEDGNVISSSGITGGVDATLHAIERLVGRAAAERVADELGYPHARFLDDPTYAVPAPDQLTPALSAAFRPTTTAIGVVLEDGVGEVALASVIDAYPRSNTGRIVPVAAARAPVASRHGLSLLPRHGVADAPRVDRVLAPGRGRPAVAPAIAAWAARAGRVVEHIHAGAGDAYPYDVTLADMARRDSRALATQAATVLEYPVDHLALGGPAWPFDALLLPLGLGLAGPALMAAVVRRRRGRPAAASVAPGAPAA